MENKKQYEHQLKHSCHAAHMVDRAGESIFFQVLQDEAENLMHTDRLCQNNNIDVTIAKNSLIKGRSFDVANCPFANKALEIFTIPA
ncbi:hypothetical protein P029_03420 [Anaplasma phagocytophilum str. Norway variant2]|uniref:Uncharacterized protein n=1 Tax=Anaplasma phagocytophilum str. Norway variant2 TaxID=1392507 RepID=A0A168HDL6_ANAPH|nr:hypothetical protein P029_03420 [Anaplasma phagocytophilum str. Norway variant2]